MEMDVVDLFCGIGGLSMGFRAQGFNVRAGIDVDAACRYAYEKNIDAPFIAKSVADVTSREIGELFSGVARRVLVGCAPCQPFSMYSGRYRQNESSEERDKRWELLDEFARLIEEVEPDVVSMENVVRVSRHPAFGKFVDRLEDAGYDVSHYKVRAQDYGVPQRRSRLVLFASRFGRIELAKPTHAAAPVTVRQAIQSLPPIAAGASAPGDRLHKARGINARNIGRLKATGEGGSWQDWSEELKLDCHKKASGRSFRSVYGRMSWDEPSPVITTQCLGIGNGRFGHPEQDRAISIREAAILQSFPSDFDFTPPGRPVSGAALSRQIGNAVPPLLGEAVARSIREHLEAVATTPR